MASREAFQPDWVSAPGDTIADILGERHISIAEFAHLMGGAAEDARDLLQGRATITIATARSLERVLGASVEFWMSRDFQYRQDTSRLNGSDEEWLRELPVGDMIKFGWLSPVPHPSGEVEACLRFFATPSVPAWREAYAGLQQMAAFRTSPSFDSRPAAVAAWLRQGEIESEAIDCGTWEPSRFQESLSNIRSLTQQKDPNRFIPELQKRCAESGVAVTIVRAPSGCRASGAIRIASRNKAILQLSFRYLTDDHFWFTFFHEAGHLLLHRERKLFRETLHGESSWFLEGVDTVSTPEEEEANEFAASTLIPPESQAEMLKLPMAVREIVRFSTRLGVSPGIVVGQLQHFGRINHDQLNSLKRRFSWGD